MANLRRPSQAGYNSGDYWVRARFGLCFHPRGHAMALF